MNKVKNMLVLQFWIEILVTVPGLDHGLPSHRRFVYSIKTEIYEIVPTR